MYQRTRWTRLACLMIGGLSCACLAAGCSDQRANEALGYRLANARQNLSRWEGKEALRAERLAADIERIEAEGQSRDERFDERVALEHRRARGREQRWFDEEPIRLGRMHRTWIGRPEGPDNTWIELLD